MSGSEHARPVWLTESHAAAIWIAHCRLKASAAANLAESGDAEGDDDWAELLLDVKAAYWDATAHAEEAADQAIEDHIVVENGTWSSLSIARAVLRALGNPS